MKQKKKKLTNFKGSVWPKLLQFIHNDISLNKSQLYKSKLKKLHEIKSTLVTF